MKNSADRGGCYPLRPKDNTDKICRIFHTYESRVTGYGELCVWFQPIRKGEIF